MAIGASARRLIAITGLVLAASLGLVSTAWSADPPTNPFTSALIHFDPDSGTIGSATPPFQSKVPGGVFYFVCWPPGDSETNTAASGSFTVASDGTLAGSCTATRTAPFGNGFQQSASKEGKVTGHYDPTAQTVTFFFEGDSTYQDAGPDCPNPCHAFAYSIVVDGPAGGAKVVGDRAEGRATFTYKCTGQTDKSQCWGAANTGTYSGTIAFFIQFMPALATPAPGSGGGGAGSADPTGGGDGFGFDPVFLLFILAALFLFILLMRLAIRRPSSMSPAELQAGMQTSDAIARTGGELAGPTPADGDTAAAKASEVVDFGAGMVGQGAAPPSGPPRDPAAAEAKAKLQADVDASTSMLMVEEMMTGSTAVSDDSAKATEEFGAESARQASTPPAGHAPAPAPPTPSDQVKDFVDTAPDFMGTDPLKKDTESR